MGRCVSNDASPTLLVIGLLMCPFEFERELVNITAEKSSLMIHDPLRAERGSEIL